MVVGEINIFIGIIGAGSFETVICNAGLATDLFCGFGDPGRIRMRSVDDGFYVFGFDQRR